MSAKSRIPLGNGKFCYSGPNCRVHNIYQNVLERYPKEEENAYQETLDSIHEDSRDIETLADLGKDALLKGIRVHWCEEHNIYHAYTSFKINLIGQEFTRSKAREVGNLYGEKGNQNKAGVQAAIETLKKLQKGGLLAALQKEDLNSYKTLYSNYLEDDSIDSEDRMDAIAEAERQYIEARNASLGSSFNPKVIEGLKVLSSSVKDDTVLKYWQCGRKRSFSAVNEANDFVSKNKDFELNPYSCSHCDGYHVGHGDGTTPVVEQVAKGREHWNAHPEKSNKFAASLNLFSD